MKKYFTYSLIVLSSILSLIGTPIREVQAAQQDDVISAEDLLRPDGTLDLTQNHHGAVDISNFDVELDPVRGPVFMPTGIDAWNPLGSGLNGIVYAIAVVGTDIYVGGEFTDAGGVAAADYIAKWDGSTWSALGSGVNNTVLAIAARGADIYVGGGFTNAGRSYIAKWDGTNWSALGSGVNSWVYSIAVRDADVYVGGIFTNAGGVAAADYIARWNGGSWSALGVGLNNTVHSIAVSGANLYVGGRFTDAGGVTTADYVASWNGSTWSTLGSGVNNWVYSIAVSETDVYVGGVFTDAGGVATADHIAKWNGSTWSALGSGVNGLVYSIAVSETDVYVGGIFSDAGGAAADNIAKWNGSAWSGLSNGVNDIIFAIALLGGDLYAGGLFVNAGGISTNDKIARYQFSSQIIVVTTNTDEITLNGQCSLREAIMAAQTNTAVDTCPGGAGHDVITFSGTVNTITLNDHLPIISDPYGLTIDGGGDVEISGNNLWHPFSVEKAGLGIGLSKPVLILENITIRGGKRASGSGGAITNDDGLVIIRNSNFVSNISGVLENYPGGYVIINNSTFGFNSSPNVSGVINNSGNSSPAVVKIYNSTISANTSTALGAVNNDSFMYIYNSIIAHNNGTTIDCSENLTYGATYGTNNLIELNQCSFSNGVNGNIIGLEAGLGGLFGYPAYFELNSGSPAIDAGSNTICAAPPVSNQSQNGVMRPQGTACDIGSFEATPTPLPTGWVGSVSVTSDDKNLVSVGRPHIGSEVASYDGFDSGSTGSTGAFVPMLFKDAFGGDYDAALYIQNVNAANSANLTLRFYDSSGALNCIKNDSLAALASKGYWLPTLTCDTGSLPAGWVGGVTVSASQNIVAVGRPHIGTEVMTYNGFTGGSTSAYIPMLFKNAFGGSYNAAYYIQNVSSSTASLTLEYYDSTGVLNCTKSDTLSARASKGYWLPAVTCDSGSLPAGWVGGVRVSSDQPVVTVGRPHIDTQITTYDGFSTGSPSSYVPMLFKGAFGGSYNAAFYLQNVSNSSASVTIKYYDNAGTLNCTKSDTIAPLASKGYWVPAATCDTGSLPAGWVGGVEVTSDQPIVSVGRPHIDAQVTTYNGFSSGALNTYLPMLFKDAFGGTYDAAFYLQNTEATAATVTIQFYDSTGALTCSRSDTIQPRATLGFWLPSATCYP